MAGFQLDPAEMRSAFARLQQCRDQVQGYLAMAAGGIGEIGDGNSLVAIQMRKAYLDRADRDGGLQAVLEDYLGELDDVLDTMSTTLETYQATDVWRAPQGEVS
jgi:hypothetical protein